MSPSTPPTGTARARTRLPSPQQIAPYFAAGLAASTALGLWASYDPAVAWPRALLILAGIILAMGVAWAGRRGGTAALGAAGIGCALLAGAVGAYFLLSFDWQALGGDKVDFIQQIGIAWQTWRPSLPLPEDLNANMAGNLLVTLMPLGVAGWLWAGRVRAWPAWLVASVALLVGLVALLLCQSRGAWLALAGGLVAAAYLALRRRLWGRQGARRLLDLLALLASLAGLAGFWFVTTSPFSADLLGSIAAGDSAISRPTLWRDGLALAGDYPLTGSGLGATMMVYSTYGRLLHVGFITHMHNLYVQLLVEQGGLALLSWLGLLAASLWNLLRTARVRRVSRSLTLPVTVSLTALILHGLVDVGAYSGLPAIVAFVPIGFALGIGTGTGWAKGRDVALAFLLVGAVLGGILVFLPAGQAALQANLGAVAQTRAELSIYSWPQWPIQDELRRTGAADLGPITARFQAALAQNPSSIAANRRLGQIELSLGQYEQARQHLEAAYARAPGQRATRQLLAEARAVTGDVDGAAELFRSAAMGEGQIEARLWWYGHIGEPEAATRIRQAVGR